MGNWLGSSEINNDNTNKNIDMNSKIKCKLHDPNCPKSKQRCEPFFLKDFKLTESHVEQEDIEHSILSNQFGLYLIQLKLDKPHTFFLKEFFKKDGKEDVEEDSKDNSIDIVKDNLKITLMLNRTIDGMIIIRTSSEFIESFHLLYLDYLEEGEKNDTASNKKVGMFVSIPINKSINSNTFLPIDLTQLKHGNGKFLLSIEKIKTISNKKDKHNNIINDKNTTEKDLSI